MNKSIGKTFKSLVYYLGVLQFLHLLSLLRAGLNYLSDHTIGFPALPPDAGWTQQANWFLLAMGYTDALIIVLSFIFIYGVINDKPWFPTIGLISPSVTMATAFIFIIGTLATGTWFVHPIGYGIIGLLFCPLLFLFLRLISIYRFSQHAG